MLKIRHPDSGCTVVLIKDTFGEVQVIFFYDVMFVDFDYHASERSEQTAHSLFGQFSGLIEAVGGNVVSAFKCVRGYDVVIAADDIRACFFPLFYELFVIVFCDPVVTVYKTDPLALGDFQALVFGSALMFVFGVSYDFKKPGIFFFVIV